MHKNNRIQHHHGTILTNYDIGEAKNWWKFVKNITVAKQKVCEFSTLIKMLRVGKLFLILANKHEQKKITITYWFHPYYFFF